MHYAYGVYLLIEQPAQAIEEFKRELNVQPNDSETLMQIAYEYLKESNAAEALPWAQQAVDAAPNSFASHRALGEALVETGDTPRASPTWSSRSSSRQTVRARTSRWPRRISAWGGRPTPRVSVRSSPGWIAWRARIGTVRSLSAARIQSAAAGSTGFVTAAVTVRP